MSKQATEFEYLEWFFAECDFGPAHEDVIYFMNQQFVEETGKELPAGYDPTKAEEPLEAELRDEED